MEERRVGGARKVELDDRSGIGIGIGGGRRKSEEEAERSERVR